MHNPANGISRERTSASRAMAARSWSATSRARPMLAQAVSQSSDTPRVVVVQGWLSSWLVHEGPRETGGKGEGGGEGEGGGGESVTAPQPQPS